MDDVLASFLEELHEQTVLHADDSDDDMLRSASGDAEARARLRNRYAELAALLGLHMRPDGVQLVDAMNEAILILSRTSPGPDFAARLASDIEESFKHMRL